MSNKSTPNGDFTDINELAKCHYENFPVVSFLVPKQLRNPIAAIYAFARTADDIADNPEKTIDERKKELSEFKSKFKARLEGKANSGFFGKIVDVINKFDLDSSLFFDLLTAFEQDLNKFDYSDWNELLSYCEKSANPVGRIILQLIGKREESLYHYSDKICTALQIANLIQDAKEDLLQNRNYFPQEFIRQFNCSLDDIKALKPDNNFKQLVLHECKLVRKMFFEGMPLLNYLPYRWKMEIGATVNGGLAVLKKIEKKRGDVFNNKIKLSKLDFIIIFAKTFLSAG
ncbi:MAG: squalene synthase HpnC [Ignavibacteria bacterium]|nr:MAG: squalene synthase HpnC [Ignavibacteria bacterium]